MKILIVLTLLIGFLWVTQDEPTIDSLNELKSIVKEYAVSKNENFISIHIDNIKDIEKKSNCEIKIYKAMKTNNIYEINYNNRGSIESVSFMLDFFFGNNKSYVYSSNGYTEAVQVKSVNDFIDKFRTNQKEQYFSICEKLEQQNWFYCENNH
ncbi:TPA: hypothetical protein ACX6RS_000013 [Photobacterium damselae]